MNFYAYAWSVIRSKIRRRKAVHPAVDPHWEVVPAVENGETIGYQVRWSKPDEQGRYFWIGHYYAGSDVSLEWCETAAERDARRKNEQRKMPCEYASFGGHTP